MALGMLVDIIDGVGKIFSEDGKWIDVDAKRIPSGLKPGMDFNYRQSKRGHINIRPPADTTVSHATNSAKDRQMYAIKRLMSPGHGPDGKGWSLAQASGIVGRFMVEAYPHLKTDAQNPNDPGTSEGLGQWNGPRKSAMRAFTAKYDNKLDGQIDFFDHEIKTSPTERLALIALEKSTTPEQAAASMMHYERPRGYRPGSPEAGLGYRQTASNAGRLAGMFDPNYQPTITADAPSAGGLDPNDPGYSQVDAGADQVIDPGQDTQEEPTLGDQIGTAALDYGAAGGAVDTSASQQFIQGMIQQGYNASTAGGYLPRLPTIDELYGNEA